MAHLFTDTKRFAWITIGLFAIILLFGSQVGAKDAPPRQVQESVQAIAKNQDRITKLRPLVEEFENLKADNARMVGRIEAFNYTFNWDTLTAEESDPK